MQRHDIYEHIRGRVTVSIMSAALLATAYMPSLTLVIPTLSWVNLLLFFEDGATTQEGSTGEL